MSKSDNFIATGKISNVMLKLAIPAILGSIIAQINFLIDSFFLGRFLDPNLSIICLAATAIALPILLIYMSVVNLFAIGGSILGARVFGTGDLKKANEVAMNSLTFGLITVLIMTVGFGLFLKPILIALGATTPELLKYSMDYATIINNYSFVILLTMYFAMFLRAEGRATIVLVTIFIQIVVNVILNYIFIVPMGLATTGAALGTVISQAVQVILYIIYSLREKLVFKLDYHRITFNFSQLKEITILGLPSTIAFLLTLVASIVLQVQANQFGETELKAAVGIIIKIVIMFLMLTQAASSGVQPIFAYSFGSKDKKRFELAKNLYIKASVIVSVVVMIFLIIFPNSLGNLFTVDPEILSYTKLGTYALAIMLSVMPVSFVFQVLFQAMDEGKKAINIVLLRQLYPFLLMVIILPLIIGEFSPLVALQIGVTIGSILVIIFYRKDLINKIQKFS